MSYDIRYAPGVDRDISRLPRGVLLRVDKAISALTNNPRPPGCQKLAGFADHWRVRVGDYRIVDVIDDTAAAVDIRIVAHRRDVYRGM